MAPLIADGTHCRFILARLNQLTFATKLNAYTTFCEWFELPIFRDAPSLKTLVALDTGSPDHIKAHTNFINRGHFKNHIHQTAGDRKII